MSSVTELPVISAHALEDLLQLVHLLVAIAELDLILGIHLRSLNKTSLGNKKGISAVQLQAVGPNGFQMLPILSNVN